MEPSQKWIRYLAIIESRGGLTTKNAAPVGAADEPVRSGPSQRHSVGDVDVLMAGTACLAFVGGKAFDAN